MGCGSSSPPPPDPNIGLAEKEQADLAAQQQQYFQTNIAPGLLDQMNQQTAIAKQQADKQGQLEDYEMGLSKQYNDRYFGTIVPLQDQMIQEAKDYNTDANREQLAGQAGADVQQSYENSEAQLQRRMRGMGINPGSAGSVAAMGDLENQRALSQAQAMNSTREAARQMGWQMSGQAAQLGSGLPSFGSAASAQSMGAGQAALGAGAAGLGAVGTAGQVAGQNFTSQAGMWNSVGNLGVQKYNADVNAYSANSGSMGAMLGGIGGLMGAAGYGYGQYMSASSKKVKTDKKTLDDDKVLQGLSKLPVASWRYKPGVGDGGTHVGPYAEDVQKQFGDGVAPGGRAINMPAMAGIRDQAIQALVAKVQQVEQEIAQLEGRK
jgi:hypothetical protein